MVQSETRTHLSLHAADPDQLVEDEESAVDSIVTVHPFLLDQSLVKPFLCLLKGLLLDEAQVPYSNSFGYGEKRFFRMMNAYKSPSLNGVCRHSWR